MSPTVFDQFRRFSTDAYGLERLLRCVQAVVQIALYISQGADPRTFLLLSGLGPDDFRRSFSDLRGRLGLARRFFRLFRFLDAFSSSYKIFLAASTGNDKDKVGSVFVETSLDAAAGGFNGMYLLLESITLVDALKIEGLAPLGPEWEAILKIESQRCWFLALACGVGVGAVRLIKAFRQLQAPAKERTVAKKEPIQQKGTGTGDNSETRRLARKVLANGLDMALPGSVIGWVPAGEGVVGAIMLLTSLLTGFEVWERCGREIGRI